MTAVYVGEMTIGAAVPGAAASATDGAAGINAAFPDIDDRVAALEAQVAALATLPPLPSFADMVDKALALHASLVVAAATPGLPPPPSIASSIATLSALIADLLTMSADLNAKLTAIVAFQSLLAAADLHVMAFDGDRADFGSQLQTLANAHVASGHVNALALVTSVGGTWSAMSSVFKVTP